MGQELGAGPEIRGCGQGLGAWSGLVLGSCIRGCARVRAQLATSYNEGLSHGLLWKMGMGLGQKKKLLFVRYYYMHSEKSSLVLIVVMLCLVYA